MWKFDPAVEAARKQAGWREFHRACGTVALYFDHIERSGGRRSDYMASAYTVRRHRDGFEPVKLADGRGATPVKALADAYHAAARPAPAAEPWLDLLLNPVAALPVEPEPVDYSEILG